ncbi:Chitinase A1 [Pseudomonas syringae pv. actinidiae]|nr:Chitinase A1 [Pseudomonas syringae pv. actinidiae]
MRIAIVTSPQTTYTDAGLTSATDYTYQIIAHDEKDGVSAGSEPLTVTTESENGGGVTAWAPGVQYQIDHLVTHQGISYKCRQSHKSIPEWSPEKPGSESLWLLLGRSAGSKH